MNQHALMIHFYGSKYLPQSNLRCHGTLMNCSTLFLQRLAPVNEKKISSTATRYFCVKKVVDIVRIFCTSVVSCMICVLLRIDCRKNNLQKESNVKKTVKSLFADTLNKMFCLHDEQRAFSECFHYSTFHVFLTF